MGLFSEVRLFSIYEGEPGLGELDKELRKQGFQPHNIINIRRMQVRNSKQFQFRRRVGRQIVDADMIYLRDLAQLAAYSDDQLKFVALLSEGVFGSLDVVVAALDELAGRGKVPKSLPEDYFRRIPPKLS